MHSGPQDHYFCLGLPTSASAEDIRARYVELAKQWHPDVCAAPDAAARFQAIAAAYQVLRDPDTRAAYDLLRNAASSIGGLEAYRKQQAARRAAHKQRRNRNSGLGGWWR
jgi:curved DNA-binding protein CbpA